jgi:putative hydrolase of the HAD superfamily
MKGEPDAGRPSWAVVFDLFTLVPFPQEHYRYLAGGLADALGLAVDDFAPAWAATFAARAIGLPTADALVKACADLGHRPSGAELAAAARRRLASCQAIFCPRPDATAVVGELRERGLRIGVLSDCGQEDVELWPQFTLAPQIDAAVFSCEEGMTKPAAALYLKVLAELEVGAASAIYVGDRDYELEGATAVGLTAFLLDAGEREEQQWEGPCLRSLSELPSVLARLDGSGPCLR